MKIETAAKTIAKAVNEALAQLRSEPVQRAIELLNDNGFLERAHKALKDVVSLRSYNEVWRALMIFARDIDRLEVAIGAMRERASYEKRKANRYYKQALKTTDAEEAYTLVCHALEIIKYTVGDCKELRNKIYLLAIELASRLYSGSTVEWLAGRALVWGEFDGEERERLEHLVAGCQIRSLMDDDGQSSVIKERGSV